MDQELFLRACAEITSGLCRDKGIGTLGEKTLHAVIKRYLEPYAGSREVKIGSFYADIVGENGIYEIQTRGFDKLRKKLDAFLPVCRVTIVYPVAHVKYLSWINPETGEVTSRRKSPKTGRIYEIFPELYRIKSFLTHENLKLCIMLIDMDEYRLLNGWSRDKKKGSSRHERIPLGLVSELYFEGSRDYAGFIPPELPIEFTSADYKKASGLNSGGSRTALNVLRSVGAVEQIGKSGRQFLYKRNGCGI